MLALSFIKKKLPKMRTFEFSRQKSKDIIWFQNQFEKWDLFLAQKTLGLQISRK